MTQGMAASFLPTPIQTWTLSRLKWPLRTSKSMEAWECSPACAELSLVVIKSKTRWRISQSSVRPWTIPLRLWVSMATCISTQPWIWRTWMVVFLNPLTNLQRARSISQCLINLTAIGKNMTTILWLRASSELWSVMPKTCFFWTATKRRREQGLSALEFDWRANHSKAKF